MKKSPKMRQVEQRHGKPLEQLIPQLYGEGGLNRVCDVLDLRKGTAYYWLTVAGYRIQHTLVRLGEADYASRI